MWRGSGGGWLGGRVQVLILFFVILLGKQLVVEHIFE